VAAKLKANWTHAAQQYLVEACLHVVESGAYADNGFKSSEWKVIATHFQNASGLMYSKDQLQSQVNELKKKYVAFKILKSNSGFGWNDGIPTCPSAVWAAVITANKDCKQFKNAGFPFYDDLGIIFAGKLATGEFASASASTQGDTWYTSDATHNTDTLNTSDITAGSRDATAGVEPARKVARSNPTKDAGAALNKVIQLLERGGNYVESALSIFEGLKVQMGLTVIESMRFKKQLADHSEYSEFFSKMSGDEQRMFIGELTGADFTSLI
jgi:hypothetical protein